MSFKQRKNKKEDFVLAGKVNASVDLVTGELTASVFDISTGGTKLPVTVSHVLKKANEHSTTDYKCGNFRLNLHQRLKEITSPNAEKNYVFIDEVGEKHDFKDKYYYIDSSGIHFIDKSSVKIGLDNKLTYEVNGVSYDVKKEQRTSSGLKLTDRAKDFINTDLLEQRHEEEIQLEDTINAYKEQLKQYVKVEKSNGNTVAGYARFKDMMNPVDGKVTPTEFNNYMSMPNTQLLFTESEAIQYNSLLLQMTKRHEDTTIGKEYTNSVYSSVNGNYFDHKNNAGVQGGFNSGNYNKSLIKLRELVRDIKEDYSKLTKKENYSIKKDDSAVDWSNPIKSNYQYVEYMNYLVEKNYRSQLQRCCADINSLATPIINLNLDQNASAGGGSNNKLDVAFLHLQANCCDLQAELERVTDALDHFDRTELKYYNGDKLDSTKTENYQKVKERQKVLEQRLRVFQKEFSNRIDKLQANITIFEKEVNDFIEKEQAELLNRQITLMLETSGRNIVEIKKVYKEYVNRIKEFEELSRQIPVTFLSSEDGCTRGFNKDGRLVAIYDSYENCAMIAWDEKGKIISATDGDGKRLEFIYKILNGCELLYQIISDNGHYIRFKYFQDAQVNNLIETTYSSGETLNITFDHNIFGNVITSSADQIQGVILYNNEGKVSKIINKSLVEIKNNKVVEADPNDAILSEISFEYNSSQTIIANKDEKKYYFFNQDGDIIRNWIKRDAEIEDVTFQKHIDDSYSITVWPKKTEKTISSNIDSIINERLGAANTDLPSGYTFAEADWEYTVFNELGCVISTQTNFKRVAENNYTKNVTIYDYDDNQLPKQKRSKVIYSNSPVTTAILNRELFEENVEKAQVEKSFYNNRGSIVESWSYVEGEEIISGINISETIYDKKGNVIRSFSYNSLDSSTKFYEEKEVAENGQILAHIDKTGENKTKYEYDDVTGEVKTTIHPNGNKCSYGSDTNTGEITSITQSTSEGVANTTNRLHVHGCLTELRSELNKINYEYDAKRRKTGVTLNGEKFVDYKYYEDIILDNKKFDKVKASFAEGKGEECIVESLSDKKGNLINVKVNEEAQFTNTYNSDNLLKKSVDHLTNTEVSYGHNDLDQVNQIITTKQGIETTKEELSYNNYGQLRNRIITVEETPFTYEYNYKENFAKDIDYITLPTKIKSKIENDVNNRVVSKELISGNDKKLGEYVSYRKIGDHATNMISSIRYGEIKRDNYIISDQLKYTYDNVGNITQIHENGKLQARYEYDKLNRLVREDNAQLGKTYLHEYDNNGNILSKRKIKFTLLDTDKINLQKRFALCGGGEDETECEEECEKLFIYDSKYPDRLKFFGGVECEYDAIGNPTVYKGDTLTWRKDRQLSTWQNKIGEILEFGYDGFGHRIKKGSTQFTYTADGKIFSEKRLMPEHDIYCGDDVHCGDELCSYSKTIQYLYDQSDVIGFIYDSNAYYYRKNLQGDVTKIFDCNGSLVVQYEYDAWGNHKVYDANKNEISASSKAHIGNINPIRYRSYYWDSETEMYWLQTRYYDPEIGRFISADAISIIDTGKDYINGLNLYAYCLNNPVMETDPSGYFIISAIIIAAVVGVVVGAGASVITQGMQNGWGNINFWQVGLDALIGGISGALAMTGLGMWALAGIGAGLGFASGVGSHFINGGTFESMFTLEAMLSIGISTAIGFVAGMAGGAGSRNAAALNKAALTKPTDAFLKAGASYSKVLTKIAEGGYKNLAGAAGARFLTGTALNAAWNQMVKGQIIKSLVFALIKSSSVTIGAAIGRGFTEY